MTKNPAVAGIDRRTLVSGVAAISAGGALTTAAQAQTKATSPGLSFAVCGDLRPIDLPLGGEDAGRPSTDIRGRVIASVESGLLATRGSGGV